MFAIKAVIVLGSQCAYLSCQEKNLLIVETVCVFSFFLVTLGLVGVTLWVWQCMDDKQGP